MQEGKCGGRERGVVVQRTFGDGVCGETLFACRVLFSPTLDPRSRAAEVVESDRLGL